MPRKNDNRKALHLRRSFANRILIFLMISVLLTTSVVFVFFYSSMQGKMKSYVMEEMENTASQMTNQISSELRSLSSIIYTSVSDPNLWQNLVRQFADTMEIWQLYSYVNAYVATLMGMNENVTLITFYIDNPTISQDKTYIRPYDEFQKLSVYDEIVARNGAARLYAMRQVFSDDYYTYNTISSPDNFCLVRASSYRGVKFGVVLEFQKKLFAKYLSGVGSHHVYLLGSNDLIQMHYADSAEEKDDLLQPLEITSSQAYSQHELLFNWKLMVVAEMHTLLSSINATFERMLIFMTLTVGVLMLIILTVFWRMTTKIRDLGNRIRSTTEEYGISNEEETVQKGDEIDQAIVSFDILKARVDYLMKEVMAREIAKRDTEIKLLYSQIKPHFLYNTLSSVLSLARRHHDPRLETMIESLSSMYRISLNQGRENITVADEIRLTENYVYIMRNRFDDLLEVTITSDPAIAESIVPKVILQPFIENSINHAMADEHVLHISVCGTIQDGDVVFTIHDDGTGITRETIQAIFAAQGEAQKGFGIRNVHQRIQMLYGSQYGVTIEPMDIGTRVTLRLPYCTLDQLPQMRHQATEHESRPDTAGKT